MEMRSMASAPNIRLHLACCQNHRHASGSKDIMRLGSRCNKKSVSRCSWHLLVQVRYSVGDCFYHAAPDEAEGKLQEGKALIYAILDMYRRRVCLPEIRLACSSLLYQCTATVKSMTHVKGLYENLHCGVLCH